MLSMLLCMIAVAQKFEITVKAEGLNDKKVYMSFYPKNDKIDSTVIKDGSFKFVKNLKNAEIILFSIEGIRASCYFFPENGKYTGSFKLEKNKFTSSINGGNLQTVFNTYTEQTNLDNQKGQKIWEEAEQAKKDKNDSLVKRLNKVMDGMRAVMGETKKQLLANNADNSFALFLVNQSIYSYDYDVLTTVLAKSNKSTQASALFATLKSKCDRLEKVRVGNMAPDFRLETPEGQKMSLSQFRGKLVILDCWASWCGPCRAESPNMVNLYNDFKDKGLTIFGVSFDQDKAAWIKAIADDKLSWNHASDLKGWKTIIAELYVVNGIPETFVIDCDGKILARGLRGEKLREKIAEILNK